MTNTITSPQNILLFPIKESEVDLWEAKIKEFGQKSLNEVLKDEALKNDLLKTEESEVWEYFREDLLEKFLDSLVSSYGKTEDCEAIIDDLADDLAMDLTTRLFSSEEDQIKVASQKVFDGLSHDEKMDLVDLSEFELHFALSVRIENEYLKSIEGNDYDEVYVCKISHQEANKLQGQLHQYVVDRATKTAKGIREMLSNNRQSDPQRELEGCLHFLEVSEGFQADFNINPEKMSNSDVIYWDTFRDYFSTAISELS